MNKLMKISFKVLDLIVIFVMTFSSPMGALAKVWTDPTDYAPGSTVWIQGDNSDGAGYMEGETVHVDVIGPLGEDGQPYTASCEDVVESPDPVNQPGYLYWTCSVTLWDSLYAVGTYNYTATGLESFVSEQGTFTDAPGSTNKVYQHWADGDAATASDAEWNNNILSANKSDYFEGEVIPHVYVYKASNQAPLTNGQSYSFNVTYNYYQQNTNAGGFAYMTTYNISRQPGPNDATNPYVAPTADSTFTNGGGTQGVFYTVDANITSVSNVTYLGTGNKDGYVTITFTYTGTTTTNGIAEIYFGLYVANPNQVPNQGAGPTKGAADWSGGSLQTTVDIGGSGATSIQLNPAAIIRGLISGVKFNDLNGNGVKDISEQGIAGWTIQLCADSACNTILQTTTTDANGAYSFSVTPDADKSTPANDPYYIREVNQSGWTQTAPGTIFYGPLTVSALTPQYLNQNFGNFRNMSVSGYKWNDVDGDAVWDSGETGLQDWTIQLDKNNDGTIDFTATTDATGRYTFTNLGPGTYKVTESLQPGWTQTFGNAGYVFTATSGQNLAGGSGIAGTYNFGNKVSFVAAPAIDVEKYVSVDGGTTWEDADLPTGPYLGSGTNPQFKFVVTNTGNVDLSSISLTDSDFNLSTCTVPSTLAAGGSFECVITGTWAAGQHTNTATASGSYAGNSYTDTDDANYYGSAASIDVEKYVSVDGGTTWEDADTAPGPYLSSGTDPQFKFVVTNTGNVTLSSISLTDSDFSLASCTIPSTLAAGASFNCIITAPWVAGQHTDAAAASGTYASTTYSDADNANYFGAAPAVDIEKTPDTQTVIYGQTATFTIVVSNTGNVALTNVTVLDLLAPDCDATFASLAVGASETYTCSIENVTSSFTNVAHASGTYGNTTVTDSDTAAVVVDILPDISVTKTANPTSVPETGGDVEFTIVVTNNSSESFVLNSLTDDKFGDLDGQGTCDVPQTIAAGDTYTCTLTKSLEGNAGTSHTNVVTASGADQQGNPDSASDDATVNFTDVAPTILVTKTPSVNSVPETGGNVTFTFTVQNTSSEESVTILSLEDSVYGTLAGDDDCGVDTVLAAGASCDFSITAWVEGDFNGPDHYNKFTAVAEDDDGTDATDDDDATVEFTDAAPAIDVTKTASPASVPETGGSVTFTFRITNTGPEAVTVTSIVDDTFGDLLATAETQNGGPITIPATQPDSYFEFTYVTTLASDSLSAHTNRVDVTAVDNDGTEAADWDDETVTFTDVAPLIEVLKTANPTHVLETGDDVTFTIEVKNIGVEDVTLTSLTDDRFGDLNGQGTCAVPQAIAVGASYTCTVTKFLFSDSLTPHTNVVTATAVDDDNTPATDTDDETVTFDNVAPIIQVTKTANPTSVPETGGNVTFTFLVENTGVEDVTLTSLTDSVFGDLNGQGDCVIGGLIPTGGSYSCSVTKFLSSDSLTAHTNVVTATAVDDDNTPVTDTDDETVTFDDVAPDIKVTKTANPTHVPETGGNVTFTFLVENIGVEDVTLTSLTDTVFGDLNGKGTCATGGIIPVGGNYSCEYTVFLSSDSLTAHYNVVTAVGTDDDGSTDTATDEETVTFDDVAPQIRITKTANPTSVPETGGDVTFTFLVENIGVEDVTLTTLSDTKFGDLDGKGTCDVPQTIAVGGSYACTYTVFLSSDSLSAHTNVVTATAVDDDGTPATDDDDETVTFDDVAPAIRITKTASPTHVPETGGDVTFTFLVENIGVEDVTLTILTDTIFGDLDGQGTCSVPQTILIGGSYSCTYTVFLNSDSLTNHYNVATATAVDDDNTPATDTDDETVTFDDVAPTIRITKTADPTHVPETGGNVTFTFLIENIGVEDVTLTELSDTAFGNLNGQGDCAVPQTILIGGNYSCSVTKFLASDSLTAHYNVSTATAVDDDDTPTTDDDDETVTFDDIAPAIRITKTASPSQILETGGNVTFTFLVENIGAEDVTLTSLTDTIFGDLDGKGTCDVPQTILIGGSYSCTYTVFLASDTLTAHTNVVTATAVDDDDTPATDDDDETVTFEDILPTITVEKTASPTNVYEPGGNVTFTFKVTNTSPEAVTIASLSDTDFTLTGDDDCKVGTVLPVGGFCEFTLTTFISGDASDPDHENTFTTTATDNDGNTATASDNATVAFEDILPTVHLIKDAMPSSLPEPGGVFTFTLTITNTSPEQVTITALTDDNALSAQCTALIGTTLAVGGSTSCQYTVTHTDAGVYPNTASVTVADNDGNTASDTAEESVTVTDVLPTVDLVKDVTPSTLPEPGGVFTFTLTITNTSVENVTITGLGDSNVLSDEDTPECKALVNQILTPGQTVSCSYNITHTDAGTYPNTAQVTVADNEGNPASDIDSETVTVTDVPPTVEVTKTANPTAVPETGGDVTFTFVVKNTSTAESVTITSLSDSVYGTLAGDADCAVNTVLAVGASCEFSITEWVEGDFSGPDHVNVFTAHVKDNEDNDASDTDNATVDFTDVAPAIEVTKTANPTLVPETGGSVTFTFVVKNTSTEEPVTITSLEDSVYGPLAGDADCAVNTVLTAGASCEFSITKWVEGDFSGPDHINVFTAVAEDNDGTDATDDDNATVDFTNVLPTIEVTKTPSVNSVPETGGDVTFTFVVKNTSTEEPVTILSLEDSVYGPLAGDADCAVATILPAGASCEFSITQWVEGDYSGSDHYNKFTAVAEDNDGTDATDDDDATVDFTDVPPTIVVTKTANPTAVPETGGDVTFTFTVKNTSSEEPVTITFLNDSVYGLLAGDDDCKLGTVLAAGAECTFSFTQLVEGDYSGPDHVNVFTAKAVDNDNTEATDDDNATVDFTNVLPTIEVTKTANPTAVPETGGDVTFTFTVKNTSSEEPVTVTSLSDSVYGPLAGDADCAVNTVLAAGAECTFSFTKWVEGDYSGPDHVNVFTAKAVDNDNTEATDTDDATVDFTNVLPTIEVTKTASETQVFAPGENVIFTFVVKNTSTEEAVTITSLEDTVYGTLAGDADCKLNTVLAAGASCEFSITRSVTADHVNVFTAKAVDNDGSEATDDDNASVDMINPSIAIDKVTVDGTTEGDGLSILTGESITWKYTVTNNGDVTLTNITVTDVPLGTICTIASLAAGASTTCTKTGTAVTGSHSNTGTASTTYTDADGDTANRSDSDGSSYFGANPQIDIVKKTVGSDGSEGDNVFVLVGATVTWRYYVTNTGNVALTNVTVTDNQPGVTVVCPQTTLAVGASMTCTATGTNTTPAGTWYNNIGTAAGSYTDSAGHSRTATDSDPSAYYSGAPGDVTNSQLCNFGPNFRLIFTPDSRYYTSTYPAYKLSDSNPGQFFYNVMYTNTTSVNTITLEIPYPFVTQGAMPVHVYGGLTVNPNNSGTPSPDNLTNCYVPTNTLASYGSIITLSSYTDTNGDGKIGFGDTVRVSVPARNGFQYINIHLDYGLEKTDRWIRQGSNANTDTSIYPNRPNIRDLTAHTFKAYANNVLIAGSTDTVYNQNDFKQVRGFGGLVYLWNGTVYVPIPATAVKLYRGTNLTSANLIETMSTDNDGWYLSNYVHRGKAATYTLVLTYGNVTRKIAVTAGGSLKFGEGIFYVGGTSNTPITP